MALERITYLPTDADTLAASSTIGAFTLDAAGVGITSTAGSGPFAGHQGLDVSIVSPITVNTEIDGFYDVSTNPNPSSADVIGYTRAATPAVTGAVNRITAADTTSDAVVAANVHGLDHNSFGMIYNGTTWDRIRGTSGSMNINIAAQSLSQVSSNVAQFGGSAVVTGTGASGAGIPRVTVSNDSNILATQSGTWTVTANAGTGTFTVSDAALANSAILNSQKGVTTTEGGILASALSSRKYLLFQNLGNKFVYLGTTGVTSANGWQVTPQSDYEFRLGPAVSVHAVAAAGTQDCRILEFS